MWGGAIQRREREIDGGEDGGANEQKVNFRKFANERSPREWKARLGNRKWCGQVGERWVRGMRWGGRALQARGQKVGNQGRGGGNLW